MRVLVTGGTGFIGCHAVSALAQSGHEVVLTARRGQEDACLPVDLKSPSSAALDSVADGGFDALLMLAWETGHGRFWTDPSNADWCASSIHMVQAFLRGGGKRVVCAGTCVEYDAPAEGPCLAGETPLAPIHPYSISKDAFRRVADWMTQDEGASLAWGRIFLAYGPHEDERRLVPSVINSLLNGEPALCSSGKQVRDFFHAEDYGRAFAALIDTDYHGTLNMCSGEPRTIADVAMAIGDALGYRDLVRLGALPDRPNEPPNLWGSSEALVDELSFRPKYSFEAGLNATIKWWQSQRQGV